MIAFISKWATSSATTAKCLCIIARQPQQSYAGKSTATACAYPHTHRSFISTSEGMAKVALDCARRTSTVSSCAFCEQEGHLAAPSPSFQTRSFLLTGGWPAWSPTARVQRGPSEAARCASTGDQQATLPSPLRGPPRIPCRFGSPRIEHTSSPFSEPLNFPQLSFAFFPFQHRHSSCSSMWPTVRMSRMGKEVIIGRHNISKCSNPSEL